VLTDGFGNPFFGVFLGCFVVRLTLRPELRVGIPRWRQQQVRQPISDDAIDLLGHRAVEAPQTCLDMRDANPELRGYDGSGHRRIHITVNDYPIRARFEQHRLDSLHDACGLNSVRF